MKIKQISIEGFRGVNRPLSLHFDDNLTVISGDNGAGKTSIFQAIEWCLFGTLDLSGTEFQREDAIVNDYHPGGQAKVELVLDDGSQLSRIRKKKNKTSFGKKDSDLVVLHDEERLTGEEAQGWIIKLLGLTAEELGVAVHLRQETIRSFIQGEPSERSETVDKMIGLLKLRELISGLDLAGLDKEIKPLEAQLKAVDQNMIRATLIAREMLVKQEDQLVSEGVSRKDITLEGEIKIFGEIDVVLQELAEQTKQSASIALPSSLESSQLTLTQSKKLAAQLQESRMGQNNQIMQSIQRFETLQGNLERAKGELETLAGIDPKSLRGQRDMTDKKLNIAKDNLKLQNGELASLRPLRSRISETENSIAIATARLQEIGKPEELEKNIESITEQMMVVEDARKSAKALSQLLPIAVEYLEKAHPSSCPVCQQNIKKLDVTLKALRQQLEDDPAAKRVEALRQEYQSLSDQKRGFEQSIKEVKETKGRLARFAGDLDKAHNELSDLLSVTSTVPLVDFINQRILTKQQEVKDLETTISELSVAVSTIDGQLRSLEAKIDSLKKARSEIINALKLPIESDELNSPIQEQIDQLNQNLAGLQALGPKFSDLNVLISRAEGVLGFLKDHETLSKLEKDYPTAVKQKEALERAIGELRELKLALQDIYQAATEQQRNLVEGSLKKLLPEINRHFSNILGHPVYSELQIIPEEEKKGVYRYWIGASDPIEMRSTYVGTRFSTAQRNAAALAIFLAMAELLPHNLDVLMIDEPTQSMDDKRKAAIAQFLANESQKRQVFIATETPEFVEILKKQTTAITVHELQPCSKEGTMISS